MQLCIEYIHEEQITLSRAFHEQFTRYMLVVVSTVATPGE